MYKKSSENFVHEANYNYLPDVNFLFYSFSLNDAIDFLINTEDNSDRESSSDEDDHDLAMLPPIEKASDDMNDGLAHHLPRRSVNSTCELSLLDNRNLCNALKPQIKNQENQLQETGKKNTDLQPTLTLSEASAVPE